MLNRDFFKILIKIIGVVLLIRVVLETTPMLIFYSSMQEGEYFQGILVALICIIILFCIIRNPNVIINIFRLDKDLENDKIEVNALNEKNILNIAVIITGGLMIANNISKSILLLYILFVGASSYIFPNHMGTTEKVEMWIPLINLVLGCVFIIWRRNIVNYFEEKNKT